MKQMLGGLAFGVTGVQSTCEAKCKDGSTIKVTCTGTCVATDYVEAFCTNDHAGSLKTCPAEKKSIAGAISSVDRSMILSQSSTAMLAQANAAPTSVLALLG